MTVTQISRQQRASYRPEIAFSRVFFEASTKDAKLPTRWANWGKKRGESPLQDDRLSVPLANIRLATAKDVSLRWSFPFDRAVQQVNELAQQELVPIYLQFDDKGLHLDSTFFRYGSNWQNQRDKSWDYVLPVSIEPNSTLVEIPHAYILLVSAIIYIMHKNMKLGAVPPISVDLMFADVAGNRYKSSFQFNIDWHDLSCSRDPAGALSALSAIGCFEPKKC